MNSWRQLYHILMHGIVARHSVIAEGYETTKVYCSCGKMVGCERRKIPTT